MVRPKVEIFGKTEALIAALENKKAVRTDGVLTAVDSWLPEGNPLHKLSLTTCLHF